MIRGGDQMIGLQGFVLFLCERGGQTFSSIGNEKYGRPMLENYIAHKEVDDFFSGSFRDGLDDNPFGKIIHGNNRMSVPRCCDRKRAYQVNSNFFERLIHPDGL